MKVKDLLVQLQQHDPEADIILTDADSGGYDCTYYLNAKVEEVLVQHTPYLTDPYRELPTWEATVLTLKGYDDLWDRSNEIKGNPFKGRDG